MLETLLTALVPALVPAVADAVRAGVGRLTGTAPAAPKTTAEAIELMAAQTERLRALAELDRPTGPISPWVANLRAAFRYVAAGVVMLWGMAASLWGWGALAMSPDAIEFAQQGALAAFAFVFGDRLYMHLQVRAR